jgi:NADH dehydrogenase
MIKTVKRPQVIIVGGGFAGLHAAQSLKRTPVDITLIDRRNFHLFQPLLYQVATAALSPADIASPLRRILRRQKNVRVMMAEVVDFNPEQKRVILDDGEVGYDFLIVAAGAGQHYFGHDNWAEYAPGLKSIEDALEIRKRILLAFEMAERETDSQARDGWLNFIIIGGGPTGVELAGTLGEIAHDAFRHDFKSYDTSQARIFLVEAGDKILPAFPRRLAERAVRALQKLGVTVMTNTRVTEIGDGYIKLGSGDMEKRLHSRTILWAAGVKASPLGQILAKRTGAEVDGAGKIKVGADLSAARFPEIFVAGDLAYVEDNRGNPLPGVAPVAVQAGRYVAAAIFARLNGRQVKPFHYRDLGLVATIGRSEAVAKIGRFHIGGFVGWLIWVFIHLMKLVEFENRLLVFIQWAWNYVTFNRTARLITGINESSPPRSNRNESDTSP